MEERQVTVEGTTHKLEPPFIAIATMNPLDDEGTYPLPAAQLDRFMMMLSVGYPPEDAEAARACQARALFSGRNFISVEDVKALAPDVLGHRVMTSDSGVGRELVAHCVERVPAPA